MNNRDAETILLYDSGELTDDEGQAVVALLAEDVEARQFFDSLKLQRNLIAADQERTRRVDIVSNTMRKFDESQRRTSRARISIPIGIAAVACILGALFLTARNTMDGPPQHAIDPLATVPTRNSRLTGLTVSTKALETEVADLIRSANFSNRKSI